MSASWTISIAGADAITLAAAGIDGCSITRTNRAGSVMTITLANRTLAAATGWSYGSEVILYRDSDIWFRGHVRTIPRLATGIITKATIQVHDAWWQLSHLVWQQKRSFANPAQASLDSDQSTVEAASQSTRSSRVWIGRDSSGKRTDIAGQITDAIAYAKTKGVYIKAGTIDATIQHPLEERQDQTCADVIDRSLFWHPEIVVFIDPSTTPPSITALNRSSRSTFTLDLLSGDWIAESIDIQPRHDLQVTGVTIHWLREHSRDGFNFNTIETETAGSDPSGLRALIVSFTLYGSYRYISSYDGDGNPIYSIADQEATPSGIAASVYDALSELQYSGTITLHYDELPAIRWPSLRVAIANGAPEWSGALLDIQSVTENIFSGMVTLTVGPPEHLYPADFASLLRDGRTSVVEAKRPAWETTTTPGTTTPDYSSQATWSWGPTNPPDVTLLYHVQIGQLGTISLGNEYVKIYDRPDGTLLATIKAADIDDGSIEIHHDVRVGRRTKTHPNYTYQNVDTNGDGFGDTTVYSPYSIFQWAYIGSPEGPNTFTRQYDPQAGYHFYKDTGTLVRVVAPQI